MQWLQAQKLPVIQAKGLELEHFYLSVSNHWITVLPPLRQRVEGVGRLAALISPGPHQGGSIHMTQPCPLAPAAQASNTKSNVHKSLVTPS